MRNILSMEEAIHTLKTLSTSIAIEDARTGYELMMKGYEIHDEKMIKDGIQKYLSGTSSATLMGLSPSEIKELIFFS